MTVTTVLDPEDKQINLENALLLLRVYFYLLGSPFDGCLILQSGSHGISGLWEF